MFRRHFFIRSAALGLATTALSGLKPGFAQTTMAPSAVGSPAGIDAVEAIKALRIPTGAYAGGYEIAPNGLLNWYFTNLGLISVVQYMSSADLDKYIRVYLDLYISKMDGNSAIQDVQFPFGRSNPAVFTLVPPDSDDSYAATTLTLAARYLKASQNWAWWDKNKLRLKDMAYYNIAVSVKSNGLTSVFQAFRKHPNNSGYLMDNCEVYRGLRDFAGLLKERGEPLEAAYYDQFATNIADSMKQLFMTGSSAFKMADLSTATDKSFYPGTTCQVFPQVFNVAELAPYYDRAWNFFSANSPRWETGALDPYPWAVLGFAAAKRGNTTIAKAQLASIEKTFATNRALVTINELGFYQRAKSLLSGRADV